MEMELINSEESVDTITLNLDIESRNSAWASLRKSISTSASEWMNPKLLETIIVSEEVDAEEIKKAEEAKKDNEVILSTLKNINSNIKDLKKEQEAYLLFQGALESLTLKINDSIKKENHLEQKQIEDELVKKNRKYLVIQTFILILSMALLKFLPL